MQSTSTYREDVNGLRAIAVLAVILFHIDPDWLPGGYIGVDVFFVISGYVITRSIVRSVGSGTFSIPQFYYARLRRLYPALLATVAASLAVASILFPPAALLQVGESALYSMAPVSLANVYFYLDADYWADDAITKPLLHMWSLAVEDQFYLIWPFLVLAALSVRPLFTAIGLGTLIVAGIAVSEAGAQFSPTAAFYMVPFRIFEFAIGAMLVPAEGRYRLMGIAWDIGIAACYMVLAAYFIIYDGSKSFLGVGAMPPLLATALLIHLGASPTVGRLITNRASAFLGATSYSQYLVHWPLIVFYSYWAFRPLILAEKLLLFVITLALGAALHVTIERRYRHFDFLSRKRDLTIGTVFTLITATVATTFWMQSGLAERSDRFISMAQIEEGKDRRFVDYRAKCRERGWETCGDVSPAGERKKLLVLGDSHGTDGFNFALSAYPESFVVLNGAPGCPPIASNSPLWERNDVRTRCFAKNAERTSPEYLRHFDIAVVSVRYSWYDAEHLASYLDEMTKAAPKLKLIVLGAYYYLTLPCPDIVQRDDDQSCTKQRYTESAFLYNDEIRSVTEKFGGLFIDKRVMCDGAVCPTFVANAPFTWDSHHLSYEFAHQLGRLSSATVGRFLNEGQATRSH